MSQTSIELIEAPSRASTAIDPHFSASTTKTEQPIPLLDRQPGRPLSAAASQPDSNASTSPIDPSDPSDDATRLSKAATAAVIASVTCISAVGSLLSGIIVVAIPRIAIDIGLDHSLLLWPTSIYALVNGCTLLLSGSVADVVGSRRMYLIGCFLQACFSLSCGLARTGTQIIVFRALSGFAISICLPSAVSIITTAFAPGQRRNVAFASMGGGQPVGFAVGLTVGGVFTDTIGWQWGFYIGAIISAVVFVLAVFFVPKSDHDRAPISFQRLVTQIDWVGALAASFSLAGLSFTLASITTNTHRLSEPLTATLFALSIALMPFFVFWMNRQMKRGKPALIPNKLWRNSNFTSITLCVFLVYGSFDSIEQLLTFYFQYVQRINALQSALRFLPMAISGTLTNIAMMFLVKRVRADAIVLVATCVCLIPPLLMALASPTTDYWQRAFPAVTLTPIGADCLYTISNLVITNSFPKDTQALAGGVFNTVSQIGQSFGIAITAIIANTITARTSGHAPLSSDTGSGGYSPDNLFAGYKGAFWFCFALNAAALIVGGWGLRKVGKVGEKRD